MEMILLNSPLTFFLNLPKVYKDRYIRSEIKLLYKVRWHREFRILPQLLQTNPLLERIPRLGTLRDLNGSQFFILVA